VQDGYDQKQLIQIRDGRADQRILSLADFFNGTGAVLLNTDIDDITRERRDPPLAENPARLRLIDCIWWLF